MVGPVSGFFSQASSLAICVPHERGLNELVLREDDGFNAGLMTQMRHDIPNIWT